MRDELFTDSKAQENFDWLHENAEPAAEAKAHRVYMEEYRKTLKSRIMKEHTELPIGAQEREAYASLRYEEHIEGLKVAVFNDEKFRWLKETKLGENDAWRTASSNRRAQI
jgi:hypothetical protein